jgi:hypothetical protein
MKVNEGIQSRLKESDNKEFRTICSQYPCKLSEVIQELVKEFNSNKSLQNRLRNRIENKKKNN